VKLPEYLRALRHRNYRIYFIGQLLAQPGPWMQQVAMGWLTYRLTQSVFMLGVVAFCTQIPVLFLGPVGGLLADRLDRRRLMVATQVFALLQSVTLAILTFSGAVQPWHLVVIALMLGAITAVDTPTRQSLTIRMVGEIRDLPNGIALNGLNFNISRLVGPAIGGVLVAWAGEGACFAVASLTYVTMIAALFMVRLPVATGGGTAARGGIRAAFSVAWKSPALRAILLMTASISLFFSPYVVLLPYFAKDVYHGNADTLGFLYSCTGAGAIACSLWMLTRQNVHSLPRGISRIVLLGGFALAVFPLMPSAWWAAPALAVIGGCSLVSGIGSNTLIQTLVRDEMRGRLMSLFTMCLLGVMPIGSLIVGRVADHIGVQVTMVLCGLATTVAALVYTRHMHHIQRALKG
jgi:predicted MFS family arabinose efflux permease